MAARTPYDDLSCEQLIAALIARDRRLAEANARIAVLEAQVGELVIKLGSKPTPQNSSLPPSQGQQPNRPDRPGQAKPKRPGFFRRALHPDPDAVVEQPVAACRHCGGTELAVVGSDDYDHHELVARPVHVTRVRLAICACGVCGKRTTAAPRQAWSRNGSSAPGCGGSSS